ncbi:MAG: DsbA family oxidoreductase [Microbacterium enclense]
MSSTDTAEPTPILIEVWADVGCPWCYVGKHRLQHAIDARPDADRFEVKIRSFELNPDAPHTPESIESAFIRSHGGNAEVVLQAERGIQALAQSEGLAFSLDRLNANTFDFHRVVQYAEEAGSGLEFFSRVQDRFFAGESNPFDAAALARTADEIGLSAERVREVLTSDEYADAVRADVEEGRELGVRGVPFTVFDRRFAASGAQSIEGYARALETAVAEAPVGAG